MPVGICKMCRLNKELARSHLVPRKAHEYCNREGHNPIVLAGGVLMASDRQMQYPLLCFECEQVLNAGGEDWCVDKLATFEKTFPLYSLVAKGRPVSADATTIYFVSDVPEVETQKIIHFGLGMFWKAAVHSWQAGTIEPRIDLGPYTDPIRKYLRHESLIPPHCHLIVNIAPPERAQIELFAPYLAEKKGWHVYYVYVPGLLFMLNVGRKVGDGPKMLCLANNPERPILSSGGLLDKFDEVSKGQMLSAKRTQSFLRAMEKVAKARGESRVAH